MPQKVIRRSLNIRHSARPPRRVSAPAGGFSSLLARLSAASDQLQRSRPKRRGI